MYLELQTAFLFPFPSLLVLNCGRTQPSSTWVGEAGAACLEQGKKGTHEGGGQDVRTVIVSAGRVMGGQYLESPSWVRGHGGA